MIGREAFMACVGSVSGALTLDHRIGVEALLPAPVGYPRSGRDWWLLIDGHDWVPYVSFFGLEIHNVVMASPGPYGERPAFVRVLTRPREVWFRLELSEPPPYEAFGDLDSSRQSTIEAGWGTSITGVSYRFNGQVDEARMRVLELPRRLVGHVSFRVADRA